MSYSFAHTKYATMNRYIDAMEELWLVVEPEHPTLDMRRMRESWEQILLLPGNNGEVHPFTRFGSVEEQEFRTILYDSLIDVLPAPYHRLITSMCVSYGSTEYESLRLVIHRYQEYVGQVTHESSDSN